MSDAQGSYKLDEAQAVLRETKAIKKAITCGEKGKARSHQGMRAPGNMGPISISSEHLSCQDLWAVSTCHTITKSSSGFLGLSASFYRRGNGGSGALHNLPKVTQCKQQNRSHGLVQGHVLATSHLTYFSKNQVEGGGFDIPPSQCGIFL